MKGVICDLIDNYGDYSNETSSLRTSYQKQKQGCHSMHEKKTQKERK
jgi:hypothetical protein